MNGAIFTVPSDTTTDTKNFRIDLAKVSVPEMQNSSGAMTEP
jgi:hypothetical protein